MHFLQVRVTLPFLLPLSKTLPKIIGSDEFFIYGHLKNNHFDKKKIF